MYTCNFCGRTFPSRQSFYAHSRWCTPYRQHKEKRKTALGTSLRQAVPKAQPDQATSPPMQPLPLPDPNDPFAPFKDFLQGVGVPLPNAGGTQETPQQRRRRLLQTAKTRAVDQYWSFTGTITAEMRAGAKLAIERELRDEPLEEFSPQEVNELAEGVRDRVYTSARRRQEKETQRTQELEERKRAAQRDDDRKHNERSKKKAAFLDEARRRVVTLLKARSLSPLQRLQVMEEVLTHLDETFTGAEPLSEAYTSIDAILQARVAEWDAHEAAREARRQEEWRELAAVIVVVIVLGFIYVKGPEILQWLLKILSPEPAADSGTAQYPTTDASHHASDEQIARRPIRRMRRPPQSPAPEPPSTPPTPDGEYPFL